VATTNKATVLVIRISPMPQGESFSRPGIMAHYLRAIDNPCAQAPKDKQQQDSGQAQHEERYFGILPTNRKPV
jgi:hypothetical protein